MFAKAPKRIFTTLAAAVLLSGCGYAPMPMTPTNGDYLMGSSQMVRQQATPALPKGVEARAISLEPAQGLAHVGESLRLSVVVKGSDNKNYTDARLVDWLVSDPQVATVDQNGVLMPLMAGTIKVIARIGAIEASAAIQVDPARYAWQQMMTPTNHNLNAVKMVTRYDAWAGGDGGVMLRYINGAWHVEPTFRVPSANIKSIDFANSNEGWAVGNRGENVPFISHYRNGVWQTTAVPVSDGFLNAVSVVDDNDAWAVGQEGNGDALILHWNGKTWQAFQAPAKGKLNDIQMLSNKRGWAVGKYDGAARAPMILKFEDGEWKKNGLWNNRDTISLTNSQELTAIKMVSETQGYAVGISDPMMLDPRGLFLEYDPKRDGWQPGKYDQSVEDIDQVPLHDIEMISGTVGWALGEVRQPDFTLERNPKSIFGNLLANDGGVLKLDTNYFSGNLSGAFYAIDLLPQGEGFVVGEHGYILQRTYDWRGTNTGYNTGYGTGYGNDYGNNSGNPVTYGPGGQAVPGQQPRVVTLNN